MAELLLEIMSEEIPARMQGRAAEDLKRLVVKGLAAAGLTPGEARAFATPRRLTAVVGDVAERQPDSREERRGPKADAPEKAIAGFLGSVGLSRDDVEERETPKGTFLFAVVERQGRPAADVVKDVVETVLADFPWPKSMRWTDHTVRWVRPVHGILCLLGGTTVAATFGPVTASNETRGHRFLAPGVIQVKDFADYGAKLRAAMVVLDAAERRATIAEAAAALATEEGLTLRDDPGLLDEVTGLVEWPVVRMGRIDETFMEVPSEVLITSMRSHLKHFSLLAGDGSMAPRFIVVANMEASDGGAAIVAGNERVLRARLADARFFWDQDRAQSLENRIPKLAERIFHAKLGTDGDKAERMAELVRVLCPFIPGAEADAAERAARLAKCDLTSEMVGEFPELQGIMGRYYALHDGEPPAVADAIADHYAPQGPGDRCPTQPLSVAVALADKLDSLIGFFGIDEKPTGSKDPFALRRAALGVIRLIMENGLRLPLREPIHEGHRLFAKYGVNFHALGHDEPEVAGHLLDFFADRLKVHLREEGVRHDLVTAVLALGGEDDLVRLVNRVRALQAFLGTDDGANLLTAYKRATNIVRIEEKKDGVSYDGDVDPARLTQDEEKALHQRLNAATALIGRAVGEERFTDAMGDLADLRAPLDAFFDRVTVNTDDGDLRANRLRMLARVRAALGGVADFSRIEG